MFKDPNYVGNRDHFNSIKGSRNFHIAFRSETVTGISTEPVVIVPKNPIANDLKVERTWDVEVKWTADDLPEEADVPETVWQCYVP
jgi:hypothetical protein